MKNNFNPNFDSGKKKKSFVPLNDKWKRKKEKESESIFIHLQSQYLIKYIFYFVIESVKMKLFHQE